MTFVNKTPLSRRDWLKTAAAAGSTSLLGAQSRPPNIVLIFADDLGYGDLGCYGSKIRTPNLDRMAAEGIRFTHFYSANPVCSPSRAALLTGRYPTRVGVPRVLFPTDKTGLPASETTIAAMLKAKGYKTMCVGKWHLGHLPEFLPTARGFDEYYGIPYSNDMNPRPLLHNQEVVEEPAKLETLTPRYTEQAVKFIERSKDSPFFLYMPHTYPHIPLAASERFRGKSPQGIYGDVLEELDWSVGQILETLKKHGLDNNTLVLFTSDNGPWYQGSPGFLRGRKGMTFEGGVRVPFIARFPGRIPKGKVCTGIASTMDLLPTIASLCNAPLPPNPLDGINIWPLLTGQKESLEREALLYFDNVYVQCARWRNWKLHIARYNTVTYSPSPAIGRMNLPLPSPELYNLETDPDESYDVAAENPKIVAEIQQRIERLITTFPEPIQQAYRETKSKRVAPTAAGAVTRPAPQ
ncbi:MAG: sulfatase [Bryobacteraceae bacterium]|nr:sulfatase [Bryobacteraceae bacterium]